MPPAAPDPSDREAQDGQRRYLFDMLEQLAAMAVACREEEVADVLYALVAIYGEGATSESDAYSTASN